jgi:IMP dehydrogenase
MGLSTRPKSSRTAPATAGSGPSRIRTDAALTFDDVLLVPRQSGTHPKDVDIVSRFTRGITLNVPLVAAAMDTVTESEMAIAMARAGGIGVLHKNMSIDRQAAEVDRVKRSESGMILKPYTLPDSATLREAASLMEKFHISGVPIVNADDRLIGIITNRDLQFERSLDRPVNAAMTTSERLITAPVGTTLDEAERIMGKHRIEKLPVVDKGGHLIGLITVKDILKRRQYPIAAKDEHGRLLVAAAIGATGAYLDRARALVEAGVDALVVDTAHGHHRNVLDATAVVREAFPNVQLIAGNIATRAAAAALVERGVDGVKVGVGPGSICTTRIVTGVGVPQLTAVMDAVEGAGDVPVIADESPGESLLLEGRRFKMIRGMGSMSAMQDGSADRYFQDGEMSAQKYVPEGIEGRVPYKRPVSDVLYQMVGGLRSGMGYVGCASIEELRTESEFVRITAAGLRESHPHDVTITREAPNYSV